MTQQGPTPAQARAAAKAQFQALAKQAESHIAEAQRALGAALTQSRDALRAAQNVLREPAKPGHDASDPHANPHTNPPADPHEHTNPDLHDESGDDPLTELYSTGNAAAMDAVNNAYAIAEGAMRKATRAVAMSLGAPQTPEESDGGEHPVPDQPEGDHPHAE